MTSEKRDRKLERVPERKSMPQNVKMSPIRLTSLETGFYTDHGLGVRERSCCARNGAWFTEKGTGAHEGVRKEGQPRP
jgi:hypothetical protein